MNNKRESIKQTKIYIGLNDAESHTQKYDTEKYVKILKVVCQNYSVPFSFMIAEGGYIHESGDYTQETCLILSLIDVEKKTVDEMTRDLCAFFHQESVLITEELVRAYFVKESLDEDGNQAEQL